MSKGKRLSILTEAEIEDLYSPPVFSESDRRFFFALNDRELEVINRIRDRKHRVVTIALLLGYFKSKPILLIPSFKSMQADLSFVAALYFGGLKYRRFILKADQKFQLYEQVLLLLGIFNWNDLAHRAGLIAYLLEKAQSWAAPHTLQ